jgi:hypothetical protein
MPTAVYDIGDKRRLTVTFTNSAGTDTDPTAVIFKIRLPDGTVTSYTYGTDAELVKSATGIYYVDWTIAAGGRHSWRFEGTGTVTQAAEQDIYARRTEAVV